MEEPRTVELHSFVRPNYHCEVGPNIEFAPGRATVRYDSYDDDDRRLWTRVVFDGAIATSFTPEFGTTKHMVDAYNAICELSSSEWINQLRERAEGRYQIVPPERRHFFIFFDHVGCFEVLARSFAVVDEPAA